MKKVLDDYVIGILLAKFFIVILTAIQYFFAI